MSLVAHLDHRALVRVEGPEARSFLNRLLTQEVETLAPGELRYGALLTPQGRLLHDLFLWGEVDAVVLDVDAGARDVLVGRLNAYRLRARASVSVEEGAVWALWEAPQAPAGWRRDPRGPALGWRAIDPVAAAAGAREVDAAAYRAHRLRLGVTDAAQDGLCDKAYATEANLDLVNGVDFSKGCFVGQETTSRMKRRGGVRSRALPLEATGAAAGDTVMAGDRRAGEVVAVAGGMALALLRLDRALEPDAALTVNDEAVRLVIPSEWRAAVAPVVETA